MMEYKMTINLCSVQIVEKNNKAEQAISRVLFPTPTLRTASRPLFERWSRTNTSQKPQQLQKWVRGDGHLSRVTVTRNLKRPTRGLGRAILRRPPIWSCSGWGLPSSCCHQQDW